MDIKWADYPAGVENDPNAPWRKKEKEKETRLVMIKALVNVSRNFIVNTTHYELDDEGNAIPKDWPSLYEDFKEQCSIKDLENTDWDIDEIDLDYAENI